MRLMTYGADVTGTSRHEQALMLASTLPIVAVVTTFLTMPTSAPHQPGQRRVSGLRRGVMLWGPGPGVECSLFWVWDGVGPS